MSDDVDYDSIIADYGDACAELQSEIDCLTRERDELRKQAVSEADRISIAYCVRQLRHAYMHLVNHGVQDQTRFADGLIAPQIRYLESLMEKYPRG